MTINFIIKTTCNPSNITCRLKHGRTIDLSSVTTILINPKFWDKKKQKIKNIIDVKNRDYLNKKLAELELFLINSFNADYSKGVIINNEWLKDKIQEYHKRPKEKENIKIHKIYYTDFALNWLEKEAPNWLTSANTYMSKNTKDQYANLIKLVIKFQEIKKTKIKISECTHATLTSFIKWLDNEDYAEKTMRRHLNRFRFFLNRAEEEKIQVDKTCSKRVYIPKQKEVIEPVLNIAEIDTIYNTTNLSEKLDNARDNLIISCWTGLRVSDLLSQLKTHHFINGMIDIKATTKTKTPVVIPIHPMVKKILEKRDGDLPKKINDADYNKQIKEICKIAGIDNKMEGRVNCKIKKRKVLGQYNKYELVTSHIGRRSFATNHYGKIDLKIISKILGHSTTDQTEDYIKITDRQYAVKLDEYWKKIQK
ncbi:tyrosine-type recombinase/integrase [Tenacibaculum sp. 190524A02b]|uniref:tyrosine-type recombinase/integrase n=1 Tax=Tenacibaculum vairaonense TaxID=3137860 RepID=UPI0031FB2647